MFQIQGSKDPKNLELHISYHNGDHYSSVRRLGDNLEAPANVTVRVSEKACQANVNLLCMCLFRQKSGFKIFRFSPISYFCPTPWTILEISVNHKKTVIAH